MIADSDKFWMQRALRLAEGGRGLASPNPVVGACVVKNGKLISSGFHAGFGAAHAEAVALKRAGKKAKAATLYVTLEPCSTWQKTPPCTGAILESGVSRVVVAALDPNPKHAGRGIRWLKNAGLKLTVGVLKHDAEAQNEGFRKWIVTNRPFVILKMAQSIDGKIATSAGDSRWISGEESRKFVHELRSRVDAIVVGKNTVRRDNPLLSVRYVKSHWQPWRFALDTCAELSPSKKMFRSGSRAVLVCSERFLKRAVKKFRASSISILPVSEKEGWIDLVAFLKKLGALGITSLMVEGGGELAGSFLDRRLVDKVYFIIAPKVIGGRSAKTSVEGDGIRALRSMAEVRNIKVFTLGKDWVVEGYCSS